jgi:hypothetical protein
LSIKSIVDYQPTIVKSFSNNTNFPHSLDTTFDLVKHSQVILHAQEKFFTRNLDLSDSLAMISVRAILRNCNPNSPKFIDVKTLNALFAIHTR